MAHMQMVVYLNIYEGQGCNAVAQTLLDIGKVLSLVPRTSKVKVKKKLKYTKKCSSIENSGFHTCVHIAPTWGPH